MSSLTTTSINTIDGVTNLTLQTGNTAAAKIIVASGGQGVVIGANSSANTITVNTSVMTANVSAAFTGNVSAATINATALNLTGSSISTTGYSRLPNGLLMQWGAQTNITFTSGTITFPIAFAAAPYSVILQGTNANTGSTVVVTGTSTTTATVRTTNTVTAQTAYWMAIGV